MTTPKPSSPTSCGPRGEWAAVLGLLLWQATPPLHLVLYVSTGWRCGGACLYLPPLQPPGIMYHCRPTSRLTHVTAERESIAVWMLHILATALDIDLLRDTVFAEAYCFGAAL